MNDETAPRGGFENSAGGRVPFDSRVIAAIRGVIERTVQPHELPGALHALWRDGFHAGAERVRIRLARAESDADYWYAVANNPADFKARHAEALKAFTIARNREATAARLAALNAAERSEVRA